MISFDLQIQKQSCRKEHRLEISNRIRNLFGQSVVIMIWNLTGHRKYVYSKQTVLYEAVKQGAFARYFDQKKLGMYLMKKLHFSAGEDILLPLAGLCMDAAVERFIIRERLGTKEIREQAFRELEKAEKEQVSDKAGTDLIHRIRLLYIRHVLENTDDEEWIHRQRLHWQDSFSEGCGKYGRCHKRDR